MAFRAYYAPIKEAHRGTDITRKRNFGLAPCVTERSMRAPADARQSLTAQLWPRAPGQRPQSVVAFFRRERSQGMTRRERRSRRCVLAERRCEGAFPGHFLGIRGCTCALSKAGFNDWADCFLKNLCAFRSILLNVISCKSLWNVNFIPN